MTTKLQPNGKFMVEPDTRRGELHVVWFSPASTSTIPGGGGASSAAAAAVTAGVAATTGHVKLEWKDRRTKTTVTVATIHNSANDPDNATFERVNTGREGDRVYLLQFGNFVIERHFFWMQDKEEELDEANCISVNLYLSDFNEAHLAAQAISGSPTAAAAGGGSSGGGAAASSSLGASGASTVDSMDNAELLRIMQGALGTNGNINDVGGARTITVPGNASIPTANAGQVDALGNILENLGVPTSTSSLRREGGTPSGERNARISLPGDATAASASSSSATAAAAGGSGSGGGGGGLTLADLQGAMAGLATASPPPSATSAGAGIVGPPLSELVSMDIIDESGILDDPSTVERLVALLPENQRSEAMLRENIRSPQVAQCLRRLTSALADEDDAGSFNSIIANFQLNPEDGALAMASGNPIEAFLNCLLRDVERKEGVKKPMMTTMEEEEGAEGDDVEDGNEDDGGSGDASGGDDGDVKMDEN